VPAGPEDERPVWRAAAVAVATETRDRSADGSRRADVDALRLRDLGPHAQTAIAAAGVGVLTFVIGIAQRRGTLRLEPFFDEMWRIDLVRAADPYEHALPGVTPIPPGWLNGIRVIEPLLGTSAVAYRLVALALFAVGAAALVVLLREWCRPLRPSPGSDAVALSTAAAAAVSFTVFAAFTELTYFSQYLFEVGYAVVLTLCCVLIGRHRLAFSLFLVLAAGSPLFVLAPVALLPPLFVVATWWAVTADAGRRARRLLALACAGIVGALIATGLFAGVYSGMSDSRGLQAFWVNETLPGAHGDPLLVWRTVGHVGTGVFGIGTVTSVWAVVAAALLIGSFAVGAVTITRRWAWYPLLIGCGWVTMYLAALVSHGPVTPVRVTLGFYWIVYATIALGAFYALAWLLRRAGARVGVQIGVIAALLVVVIVGLWPAHSTADDSPFARGLLSDLERVAVSQTRANLVLSYHYMSHVYTHDRFVNRAPSEREYVVRGQRGPRDQRLFDDVDALVRRYLPEGGTLWCVIPYALGPEDSGRACKPAQGLQEIERHPGTQAWIIGFAVPPNGPGPRHA